MQLFSVFTVLRFRSYEAKCVVLLLGCFRRGSTSLHSNFTWTGSSPTNHSWQQKTRITGLPDCEDRIPLRSLVLTQYRSVTDGRTDGRTDAFAVAYTALAKLALRRAVIRTGNVDKLYFSVNSLDFLLITQIYFDYFCFHFTIILTTFYNPLLCWKELLA